MRAYAAARLPPSTRRRWLAEIACWRLAIVLGTLLLTPVALSQPSATATLVSDYRLRGVSLSDDKPAAQATLVLDSPTGWYGGVFASTVKLPGTAHISAQAVAFVGYAGPIRSGLHWDAGVDYSAFIQTPEYNYAELYAGFTSGEVNGRVHFSPSYFALDSASVYIEINGTHRLSDRFSLVLHAGLLAPNISRARLWPRITERGSAPAPIFADTRITATLQIRRAGARLNVVGASSPLNLPNVPQEIYDAIFDPIDPQPFALELLVDLTTGDGSAALLVGESVFFGDFQLTAFDSDAGPPITAVGPSIAIANAPGLSASVRVRDFKIFAPKFGSNR